LKGIRRLSEPAVLPWYEPAPVSFFTRRPSYPWIVVGTVCVGAFMGQLDASIAQLVLPELEREFQASLSSVSWVAVAYLLTVAALLPVFGRLADIMGRKMLYSGGFLVFVAGSTLCGFAPSLEVLIAARVLQGVGAVLMQANSVAIIVAAVGGANRGRALGLQAAAQAVGLSTGPVLGGLLISSLGWRWVFFLNLPVGLLGTTLALLALPQTRRVGKPPGFDWAGAVLLMPAMTALMIALNEGASWGLASPALIGCLALGTLLLAAFIRRELRIASPLLDLSLFRDRAFSAGNLAGLLSYGILFGVFFLLPFAFERIYAASALEAGLRLAVIPVMLGCLAPVSGWLSDRLGPRWLTVGGMLVTSAALALLFVTLDGSPGRLWLVTLALAIFGLGLGLFTAPNNSAIMSSASASQTGEAGGVLNLMRSFGMSTGIATAAALLSWQLAAMAGHGADTLHAPRPELIAAAHSVIAVFAGVALLAAAASLIRGRPAPTR
jgi:EmrB/QacA subfamily drug resistance transporter